MVYFHGFASSGATGTAELLRKIFPSSEILAPDIPVDPAEALPYLKAFCEEHHPDVVVGTSMGGMYAQQMRGFLRICVNPAFRMSTMSKVLHTGTFSTDARTAKRSFASQPTSFAISTKWSAISLTTSPPRNANYVTACLERATRRSIQSTPIIHSRNIMRMPSVSTANTSSTSVPSVMHFCLCSNACLENVMKHRRKSRCPII